MVDVDDDDDDDDERGLEARSAMLALKNGNKGNKLGTKNSQN